MYGTVRATIWCYSLYEFEVYGTIDTVTVDGLGSTPAQGKQMKIFPNPASASDGNIFVSLEGINENEKVKIIVTDLAGKVVYVLNTSKLGTTTVPINNLKGGVYILKAEAGENIFINRFVINAN